MSRKFEEPKFEKTEFEAVAYLCKGSTPTNPFEFPYGSNGKGSHKGGSHQGGSHDNGSHKGGSHKGW